MIALAEHERSVAAMCYGKYVGVNQEHSQIGGGSMGVRMVSKFGSESAHCGSKHRIENRRIAKEIAERMNSRSKARGRVVPYRCDYCGWWHVGTETRH